MLEKHFSDAITLATKLFHLREQFIDALRAVANARIEQSHGRSLHLAGIVSRRALESHADDALYAIGRDGADRVEDSVRHAVDEVVRETLNAAGKASN